MITDKHYGGDNIGKGKRGKQDGTGPHEDSYMNRVGRSGRKAGHKKGKC